MENILAKINILNESHYKQTINNVLLNNQKRTFCYLNTQVFYEIERNKEFQNAFNNFDFVIPDGTSVVWSKNHLLKTNIQKVVFTYSYFNFMRDFFIQNKIKLFFLGAKHETILKAVKLEKEKYPELLISGFQDGYFFDQETSDEIIELINSSKAQVLIVGMGCPKAELWIHQNFSKINVNAIFSVGGFFDFLAKDKIQAPKWMYNSGFEWLFRLIQEPRRLWKRYLVSNIYWLYRLIKSISVDKFFH